MEVAVARRHPLQRQALLDQLLLDAREVPVERRGGAFGIVFGVRTMSIAVSSIAGGWASAHIGIRGVFAVTGAVLLYSAWSMRRTLRAA